MLFMIEMHATDEVIYIDKIISRDILIFCKILEK